VLLGGLGLTLAWLLRAARTRRIARERLLPRVESPIAPRIRPFATRHRFVPWVVSAGLGLLGWWLAPFPWIYTAALAAVAGLCAWQADIILQQRRHARIESQLADAIDLMIAAVRVGASPQAALESYLTEARPPLRPQIEDLLARIRLGDNPADAFESLARRVPLETFRLFATAMTVNLQVGGGLAETLATVGRTVRDRMEIGRRIQAVTAQARASVAVMLAVSYFIAILMWRNDPDRMLGFLGSTIGQYVVAAALVAQGLGIVWVANLVRPKF
jgi:tight adherence protein B